MCKFYRQRVKTTLRTWRLIRTTLVRFKISITQLESGNASKNHVVSL